MDGGRQQIQFGIDRWLPADASRIRHIRNGLPAPTVDVMIREYNIVVDRSTEQIPLAVNQTNAPFHSGNGGCVNVPRPPPYKACSFCSAVYSVTRSSRVSDASTRA